MIDTNFNQSNFKLKFSVKDSTGINTGSIQVYFDSLNTQNFTYDDTTGELSLPLQNVSYGEHVVRILATNKNGNHAFPFHHKIFVHGMTEN